MERRRGAVAGPTFRFTSALLLPRITPYGGLRFFRGIPMRNELLAGLAALALTAAAAEAQISEIRVGIVAHDLARNIEDGVQISGQLVFDSPGFLAPVWSPRPYLYGSFNSAGNTNLAAAGMLWTASLSERWSLGTGLGIAYHDGVRDISQLPPSDPDRIRLAGSRALLGSRFLFHTQLGVDYAVTPSVAVGVYYEHFSNGQILGQGRNQGLDEFGARISWRFGR